MTQSDKIFDSFFLLNYTFFITGHTTYRGDSVMNDKKEQDNKKTATNNQWVSTGITRPTDESVRKDGPGGENAK